MAAYSMDLRARVAAACAAGTQTRAEVAERFAVSVSRARRLLHRRRETGSLAPEPHGGGRAPAFDAAAADRLRRAVADPPDAPRKELARARAVACSTSAVDRALARLGITRKRRRSGPRSRTGPTCERRGTTGGPRSPGSSRPGWCSSARAGRPPR